MDMVRDILVLLTGATYLSLFVFSAAGLQSCATKAPRIPRGRTVWQQRVRAIPPRSGSDPSGSQRLLRSLIVSGTLRLWMQTADDAEPACPRSQYQWHAVIPQSFLRKSLYDSQFQTRKPFRSLPPNVSEIRRRADVHRQT